MLLVNATFVAQQHVNEKYLCVVVSPTQHQSIKANHSAEYTLACMSTICIFRDVRWYIYIYSPTWNVHEQCTFHVGLYIYTSGWQQPGPPLPQLISYGPTFKAISHCFCIFLGTKCLASGFSDRRGLLICRCYCEALKAMLVGEVY